MITPINATLFVPILMQLISLVKLVARTRLNAQIDSEILDKQLLPNHNLIMLIIHVIFLTNSYFKMKYPAKKIRLMKIDKLMRLLHGYRYEVKFYSH